MYHIYKKLKFITKKHVFQTIGRKIFQMILYTENYFLFTFYFKTSVL